MDREGTHTTDREGTQWTGKAHRAGCGTVYSIPYAPPLAPRNPRQRCHCAEKVTNVGASRSK